MRRAWWMCVMAVCLLGCSTDRSSAPAPDLPDDVLPWGDEATEAARPRACAVAPEPRGPGSLGIEVDAFVGCVEGLLGASGLPGEVELPFSRKGELPLKLELPGLMRMSLLSNGAGEVTSVDVIFLDGLREKHGYDPELKAQYAVLAALVPSAGADLGRGERLFASIDARGRSRDTARIVSTWDGVEIASSFQSTSVMYQVRAARAAERAAE